MGTLDGRVAIVTGAGRGIGASIARLFAAEGAKLVLNDLGGGPDGRGGDDGPAREVAESVNEAGGQAVADGGDVADSATGERLVNLALENYGRLDIVVNSAGILRDKMIFNLPEEDWDAVIRVHLRGHYCTIRPAAAYWREQRNPDGHFRIINFTSDSGLQGSPGQPNYAAAKMGIIGLTSSLANGLARYGVTANSIAPGALTRLSGAIPADKGLGRDPERDRVLSPDNIAPIAAYLAGTDSDWLSGRTLGAAAYEVRLWNDPQVIDTIESDGPWELQDLAARLEKSFRPKADGLRPSVFSAQIPGAAPRSI